MSGLANNELQRTRDGNAAASPLNSVLGRPDSGLPRVVSAVDRM